jgi:hypothetical protein
VLLPNTFHLLYVFNTKVSIDLSVQADYLADDVEPGTVDMFLEVYLLTQNLHLAPSTQQAEQAGFTREEITRRASQFSLKINKRQTKAWNLPGGTRQFHIYGYRAK